MQTVSLRDLFSLLDENGEGYLGKMQIQRAIALLGRGDISEAQCNHILKGCTDDGTYKVGYAGFCRAIQKIERERTPLVRQLAACKAIGRSRQLANPEEWVEVDRHRSRKLLAYLLVKHPFLEQRLGEAQQFVEHHQRSSGEQGLGREVTLPPHPQLCAHSHCTLNHDFLPIKWTKQPPRWDPETPSASWASLSSKHLPPPAPSSRRRNATNSRMRRAGFESLMRTSAPAGSLGPGRPGHGEERPCTSDQYHSHHHHYTHRPMSEPGPVDVMQHCLPSSQASPSSSSADPSRLFPADQSSFSPSGSAPGQAHADSLQATRETRATRTTHSSMPRLASDAPFDATGGSLATFSDKSYGINHRPQTAPEGAMLGRMTQFHNGENGLSVSRGSARSTSAFSQSTNRRVQSCEGNYWNWGSAPLQNKAKNTQSVYELPVQSPWRLGKYRSKKSSGWDHPTPWRTPRYHARGSGYEETHMHNMAVALMKSMAT
mmetsp:Transcript_21434/g.40825  ORF Transcript_21434/g.40825 Transcript_21434/m.40825 type:complete len:488 (+) Transcript_21434:91-1554(+)